MLALIPAGVVGSATFGKSLASSEDRCEELTWPSFLHVVRQGMIATTST